MNQNERVIGTKYCQVAPRYVSWIQLRIKRQFECLVLALFLHGVQILEVTSQISTVPGMTV